MLTVSKYEDLKSLLGFPVTRTLYSTENNHLVVQ